MSTEKWNAPAIGPVTGRRQSLRGFDPEYADIVDYILRSTQRIWEEKNVGLVYTHYLHNSAVHTPYGTTYGRDARHCQYAANAGGLPRPQALRRGCDLDRE